MQGGPRETKEPTNPTLKFSGGKGTKCSDVPQDAHLRRMQNQLGFTPLPTSLPAAI